MEIEQDKNKRIAKNTLYLYFRSFLLLGLCLYTSRLILSILGIDDYGIYNVVGGVVAMFTLLNNAMSSASQRYITYALGEEDNSNVYRVFQTCVNLHYIIAILMVVLLEAVGVWFVNTQLNLPAGRMTAANYVLQFSILTLFVCIINVPYNALIVAHEHMKAFAFIGIIDALEKLGIVLLLSIIDIDHLILYSILIFLCSVVLRVIYGIYCHKEFGETRKLRFEIDKSLFREMSAFSGWNLFGQGSYLLRNQGIDILLNIFFGVTVNAAKGVCNQVQSAVSTFVSDFQSAIYPQITKSLAEDDIKRVHNLIITGSRISFFLLAVLAIPLSINLKEVLELWLVEVPDYAVIFIQLTMIFMLMDCFSRFLIHGLDSTGNIRNTQIVVGITKCMSLPITYLFLKNGGSPATGLLVNIGVELFCLSERIYFSEKQLKLPVYDFVLNVVTRCVFVCLIAFSTACLLTKLLSIHFVINILVDVLLTMAIIYVIGFKDMERVALKKQILKYANSHA